MARRDDNLQARLDRDLAELKLPEIAKNYREVLDEVARKGGSMLELLTLLFGMERAAQQQRALERRLREARLPKQKTVAEYDFKFPKRIPKATIMRLFDCDFIERHECGVLIGPTGTGKWACKSFCVSAGGNEVCELSPGPGPGVGSRR
jgi:DNA replication protein DnaC